MRIKFINLAAQNQEIAARISHELEKIHARTAYVGGEQVEKFEQEYLSLVEVLGVDGLRQLIEEARQTQ